MPFESQITQLSTEQLDKLFESTPDTTPTADNLAVGKTGDTPSVPSGLDNIPFVENIDEVLDNEDTVEPQEPVKKDGEESTKKDSTKSTDDAAESKNIENDELDGSDDTVDDSPTANVNEVLKNTVDYLIKSGKWVDFEGREDLEVTEEVYAELAKKQDEYRVSTMFNELLDSTGDYGKAIISHIKNGGNPDEIIDLFKEQKQVTQIDTSTEDGKQQLIEKYYSDVLGWKPEKVAKTVKRLISEDEINSEFDDVKEMYNEHYENRLKEINEQNRQKEIENIRKQEVFVNNIKTALDGNTDLTEKDKQLIAGSILNFRHKLDNGQKVNDFYIKFAEKQADPREYVDLVRFVMDKEGYLKSISRKLTTKANAEAFNFIKGNTAINKKSTQEIKINGNPDKARRGTDFSFALKK